MKSINQPSSGDSQCPDGFQLINLNENDTLYILNSAEIVGGYLAPYGSNHTFVVFLDAGEKKCLRAIYKPEKGERPLRDFPVGTLYQRELAAAKLSKHLGWPNIPLTISRDGPYGVGIFQQYIDHDPKTTYFELYEKTAFAPKLEQIALFDLIANNADRKAGHCILDYSEKIWSIDHGLTFHQSFKLRTVMVDFWGKEISKKLLEDLHCIGKNILPNRNSAFVDVSSLISNQEYESLKFRVEYLLQNPIFPILDPSFNIPYPLV